MLLYAASKSDEFFLIHFMRKKFRMGYDTRMMHPPSAVRVPTLSVFPTTYF